MRLSLLLLPVLLAAQPAFAAVDLIRVDKSERKLWLLDGATVVREYDIHLGANPEGPKEREGDGRTPEGRYLISGKNPNSRFTLSLRVSYPGADDRAAAAKSGVNPGGDIMVHGQPNAVPDAFVIPTDWTLGCIAVSNTAIREIYDLVDIGTPIEILP